LGLFVLIIMKVLKKPLTIYTIKIFLKLVNPSTVAGH